MKKEEKSGTTKRIEDKYIISKDHYLRFKKLADAFMKHQVYGYNTDYVINGSIYFDTPDLDCLVAHLKGDQQRHKIRIRTYAPEGVPSNERFVEIKRKDGENCIKDRIRIGLDAYRNLLEKSELPVDQELIVLNEDDIGEAETIVKARMLNEMLKKGKYKPVVEIHYRRESFEADDGFRITIDQDLKVKPLPDMKNSKVRKEYEAELDKVDEKYLNYEDFIMEVKHQGELPKWLRKKLKKHFFEPISFSKYCWAMARTLGNELRVNES